MRHKRRNLHILVLKVSKGAARQRVRILHGAVRAACHNHLVLHIISKHREKAQYQRRVQLIIAGSLISPLAYLGTHRMDFTVVYEEAIVCI